MVSAAEVGEAVVSGCVLATIVKEAEVYTSVIGCNQHGTITLIITYFATSNRYEKAMRWAYAPFSSPQTVDKVRDAVLAQPFVKMIVTSYDGRCSPPGTKPEYFFVAAPL
jgi:hypothetical protein